MNHRWCGSFLALLLLGAIGCAARRPVLYPNEHLASVGAEAAERDVDECISLADDYARSGRDHRGFARGTAAGAVTGAAAGAVGGAIWGNAGRGAASGAAAGATASLLHRIFRRPDPSAAHKGFVARCLSERGYELIGWQ